MTETLSPELAEMKTKVKDASAFLKKVSNPDRLPGIRRPGLSQQLAELRAAGLVKGRKDGKQGYRIWGPCALAHP